MDIQLRQQVEVLHHATSTWVGWPARSDSGKSAKLEAVKVASIPSLYPLWELLNVYEDHHMFM